MSSSGGIHPPMRQIRSMLAALFAVASVASARESLIALNLPLNSAVAGSYAQSPQSSPAPNSAPQASYSASEVRAAPPYCWDGNVRGLEATTRGGVEMVGVPTVRDMTAEEAEAASARRFPGSRPATCIEVATWIMRHRMGERTRLLRLLPFVGLDIAEEPSRPGNLDLLP